MKYPIWPIIIFIIFQLMPFNSWPDDGALTNSKDKSSTEKRLKTISVQVGSFIELQKAEQELIRLKSYSLDPFMRHELVPNKGIWYRIFVGRFREVETAKKFAQRLKDQGIIPGFWVKRIDMPLDQVKSSQTTTEKTDQPELKIAAEAEKQAPPSAMVEMPVAVIPPKEEEPLVPPTPIDISKGVILPKDKPSPPPIQVEMPNVIIPEKDQEPASTEKKEQKEILPPDNIQEDQLILPVQDADKDKETGKFSFGIKSSFFLLPKAEDFIITRTTEIDSRSWSFQDKIAYNSLSSTYRLNSAFLIEASIERAFFSYLDLWHLNVGPKIEFRKIGMLTPYAKGSLVIGHLKWDGAPGDFSLASGWECGFGISLIKSNIQFGFETSYRAIKYDYNLPSEAGITATDSQLDFSGYALSATLGYWF
jgi:hypothetical protein